MPSELTLKQIAADMAKEHGIPKNKAEAMLKGVVSQISKHIAAHDNNVVAFGGLFRAQTKNRASRTGRNPKTGEAITIEAKKVVVFKPGKNALLL